MASKIASEIWSATLSGWPSETDSEVKRKLLDMKKAPLFQRFVGVADPENPEPSERFSRICESPRK
jgi:hypothetical protein